MGFKDVTYHHGGSLEQGKDIVMWRPEPPRERVSYAVVVKVERISGNVNSAGAVLTQVKQAIGAPYIDKKTHEEYKISHCFVVTSHEIQKEGTNSMRSLLSSDNLLDRVTLIDEDELLRLLGRFLPQSLIIASLRESFDSLPQVPDHKVHVEVTKEGTKFVVSPETENSKPLTINLMPDFRDTPEGREKLKEFEGFLRFGAPVEFDEKAIRSLQLPEFLRNLLPHDITSLQVRLGPARLSQPILLALEFEAPDGEMFKLPYLDFRTVQGGSDEVTISNDDQPIPFRIRLSFKKNSSRGGFSYSVPLVGEGVHWLAHALAFERILAKGPSVYLSDLTDGLRQLFFEIPVGTVQPPYEGFLELAKRVVRIQNLTHTKIAVPNRHYFTPEDFEAILAVEHILEDGHHRSEINEVAITLSAEEIANVGLLLLKEPIGPISFFKPSEVYPVLDTPVSLGPVDVILHAAKLVDNDRIRIEAALRCKSVEEKVIVRLVPNKGTTIEVRFRDWGLQAKKRR